MAIEAALVALLAADAPYTALVDKRTYPLRLPDRPAPGVAQFPAVVYQRISGDREYSQDGDSRLPHPRYQFSVWGPDYTATRAAANALRTAISGYRGTVGGVFIQAIFIESEQELFEIETKLNRVLIDAIIWHKD